MYVLPVLLLMGVIFGLSSQTYQKQDIRSWIKKEIPDKVIKDHFSNTSINYGSQTVSLKTSNASSFVEFLIRKSAHFLIFCVLGMLLARFFRVILKWRFVWNLLISTLLCTGYAITDEFHQSFTTGRFSRPADVILDTVGAVFGILLYLSLSQLFKAIRKRKEVFHQQN